MSAVDLQEDVGDSTTLSPSERDASAHSVPASAPSAADDMVGKRIAEKYLVLSVLGRGGMSAVYLARHEVMNKIVAVKVLHEHLRGSEQTLRRFKQESQAAAALDHPNVINVYDCGVTAAGQPFLVMDYLQGVALSDLIKRDGPLPLERAIPIFQQICAALGEAHKRGIIHRDLKPSNVMMVSHGDTADFVKIVDFGIAKLLPQEGEELKQLTQTGETFGSPLYMSPEQCLAQQLDLRTDIYALGCLMYETVAGRPPLAGGNVYETIFKQLNEVPDTLAGVIKDKSLCREFEAVVFKALAKEREKRYGSMQELSDDLSVVLSGAKRGLFGQLVTRARLAWLKRLPNKKAQIGVSAVLALSVTLLAQCGYWTLSNVRNAAEIDSSVRKQMGQATELGPFLVPVQQTTAGDTETSFAALRNLAPQNIADEFNHRAAAATVLAQSGSFKQSLDMLDIAFARARSHEVEIGHFSLHKAYLVRGNCYYALGQWTSAFDMFSRAVATALSRKDRLVSIARARMADSLVEAGDLKPAIQLYLAILSGQHFTTFDGMSFADAIHHRYEELDPDSAAKIEILEPDSQLNRLVLLKLADAVRADAESASDPLVKSTGLRSALKLYERYRTTYSTESGTSGYLYACYFSGLIMNELGDRKGALNLLAGIERSTASQSSISRFEGLQKPPDPAALKAACRKAYGALLWSDGHLFEGAQLMSSKAE